MDRSHAWTKSFTGTLVYLKKIFTVLLPKYICCLGPTHTHTEQSPLSHKPFCNGFPCFASVRGKRRWWREEKPSVVVINHLLVLSHLSPSRSPSHAIPQCPPPPGTQSSPQHRNTLESLFHCTASQHPSLLWFAYSISLQPSSTRFIIFKDKLYWHIFFLTLFVSFLTLRRSNIQA